MPNRRRKTSITPGKVTPSSSGVSFASALLSSSDDDEDELTLLKNHHQAPGRKSLHSQTVEFHNISTIREDSVEEGFGLIASTPAPRRRRPQTNSTRSHSDAIKNSFRINADSSSRSLLGKMRRLRLYGGDYFERFPVALRSAIAPMILFSATQIPDQQWFLGAWIANIFLHFALTTPNFGSCVQLVRGFGCSLIFVTVLSLPVAYGITKMNYTAALASFPFIVAALTGLIMTCPWLHSPNLLVVAMYLAVANPVHQITDGAWIWWHPFGLLNSYLAGLFIALLMHILIPIPWKPNLATRQTHDLLEALSEDMALLFTQTRNYTNSAGHLRLKSRAALASVQVIGKRIDDRICSLASLLSACETELNMFGRTDAVERLQLGVAYLQKHSTFFRTHHTILNQRFLGEEFSSRNVQSKKVRLIISRQVRPFYETYMNELIQASQDCLHQIDPFLYKRNCQPRDKTFQSTIILEHALKNLQVAFRKAAEEATESARSASSRDVTGEGATPILAHIGRRMTTFQMLFDIGKGTFKCKQDLLQLAMKNCAKREDTSDCGYTASLRYEEDTTWKTEAETPNSSQSHYFRLLKAGAYLKTNFLSAQWKWRDSTNRRLAMKLSLGMAISSLYVSVPYLWESSASLFGVWPGVTVAVVNLAQTGSSFHKAIDRLIGTLFAAAFALIVTDYFHGNRDAFLISAIGVFSFLAIWMRTTEHAYAATYAAMSIGAMLYGGSANDVPIDTYVPLRIELITLGVIIFSLIELSVFRKSSRDVVEADILEFFRSVYGFICKAAEFTARMEDFVTLEASVAASTVGDEEGEDIETGKLVRHERWETDECTNRLIEFRKSYQLLKNKSDVLKAELPQALKEPHFGFAQRMDGSSLTSLVKGANDVATQATLLADILESLGRQYEENPSFFQQMHWPQAFEHIFVQIRDQTSLMLLALQDAFPDGRLRPQCNNTLGAVAAASTFRSYDDTRLLLLSSFSKHYQTYLEAMDGSRPELSTSSSSEEIMTLSIATSFSLEFCRHLQKCGKSMEAYARTFPKSYRN